MASLTTTSAMEGLVLSTHLAPELDSPPLSPKISAFRYAQLACRRNLVYAQSSSL